MRLPSRGSGMRKTGAGLGGLAETNQRGKRGPNRGGARTQTVRQRGWSEGALNRGHLGRTGLLWKADVKEVL